ncbi:MAG TPA: cytochrome c maturation protein CcmE [Myxococcaceae bacterium]|jgi:cytochrome c-type biogenesis protein CcmE
MKTQTKNRLLALGALAAAGGALAYVALGGLSENLVYYYTPGEVRAKGAAAASGVVRLGGIVKPGTIVWDEAHTHLTFEVADNHKEGAPSVKVSANEIPPQMFRDGIGVLVEGTYTPPDAFTSNRLIVKHSNEYKPPKDGEKPSMTTAQELSKP